MSAQPKIAKTKPPATLTELEARQADLEHKLLLAERATGQARQDLANARKMADAEAIAVARQLIRRSAADAADLQDALADARASIEEVKARAHLQFETNRLKALVRLAGEMVATSEALEAATAEWAAKRKAAIAAAADFETELAHCNIVFDAFLSVATRMDSRIDVLLWLETEGTYGRSRSMDTPTELRESRRASLGLAAQDFRTLTLRTARAQFGISEI